MGVIIRQSFKGTFVGYLGAILGGITLVFIQPYFLSPELIGLTRIMLEFATLLAFLSQFSITNAIVKYQPYFDFGEKKRKLFKLIIIVPFIGFIIVAFLILCFKSTITNFYSEKSGLFTDYFYLIFPFTLIIIYLNIFEVYSTTLNRITIPKLIRDFIIRILTITCILAFAFYHLTINAFIYLFVLTYFIAAICNILYASRLTRFDTIQVTDLPLDNKLYRQIGIYMLFAFIAGIGSNLVVRADTLMISSMLGLEKTGIYSISFFIAAMVEIPSKTTLMISGPTISRNLVLSNIGEIEEIYKKNTLNQSIIGGLLLILIWANINNIFEIMPSGDLYKDGKYVLVFIALAKFYDSVTGMNNQIIIYSKYYKIIIIYVLISAILIIGGNYFLIPIFGITGAAMSYFAGFFFINTVSIIFIYFKFGIQPFKKQMLLLLILYFVCFIINYFIPTLGNCYLDSVLRSSVIIAIFAVSVYKLNISPELSQLVLNLIKVKGIMNFLKGK